MAFTNPPAWTTAQSLIGNTPNFNPSVGVTSNALPAQLDPATLQALQSLGWGGGNPILSNPGSGGNQDTGPTPGSNTFSPGFQAWMAQNGISPLTGTSPNGDDFALYNSSSTGPNSGVVGQHQITNYGGNSNPLLMAALAAGLGGSVLAAGGLGAGADAAQAGAAASDAGGGSIAAGGGGSALGAGGAAASSGGLGAIGSVGSAAGSAGSLLGGLSGSQIGGLVGAAGGLLANGSGLNSATQTNKNTVDPRIAQYIYGADGNSGLLGGVNSLYQKQMATGGLNALQQQGIASQQAVLQDPNYATGFNQMRSVGSGLLSQPIAGNPFSTGQRSLDPSTPGSLMQAGAGPIPIGQQFVPQPRSQIPMQPGLLGSR